MNERQIAASHADSSPNVKPIFSVHAGEYLVATHNRPLLGECLNTTIEVVQPLMTSAIQGWSDQFVQEARANKGMV